MFKQLLWKELREQRWKLIFGMVMLLFFTGTLLAARITSGREVLVVVWMIGGLVLALYSAMGVFAPETVNGTHIFLTSKPIRPSKVFFGKWIVGWLGFAVPMCVCSSLLALLILFHSQGRLFELKYIARGSFAGVALGTMLYTMTCCFAPRKSGEAMVGFTGLILCVVFILHIMFMMTITTIGRNQFSFANEAVIYLNPLMWFNFISRMSSDMHLWLLVMEQIVLFVLTILYGYRRWRRG